MDAEKASPLQKKLLSQMVRRGLNGQRLAKISQVSDSEISRILAGKSQPGLENAFRLARAVGVSLDYLADEAMELDPASEASGAAEGEILGLARELGHRPARRILETACDLGYELAIRRLLGAEARPAAEAGPAV